MRNVPNDQNALPPVLDLEWNNHSSCKNKHDRADILEKVRVMLAAMEQHTGKVPIIYTDMTFYRDILEGEQFDPRSGCARTAAEPHLKYQQPALAVLAVDADRHDVGRAHRGRSQRLLRQRDRVGQLPADRLRSAHRAMAWAPGALPEPEVIAVHWELRVVARANRKPLRTFPAHAPRRQLVTNRGQS